MGLRILVGVEDGDSGGRAVLYCSTSMRALPFLFDDEADAERFLERHGDVRRLTEFEQACLFDSRPRLSEEDPDRPGRVLQAPIVKLRTSSTYGKVRP